MKATIVGIIFICILGLVAIGGYFFVSRSNQQPVTTKTVKEAKNTTVTGVLTKVSSPKDDYSHVITAKSKITGVSSYSVQLDQYIGKTVTATGQFSGTTLYIDTITESK
jgi:hypothetical protein